MDKLKQDIQKIDTKMAAIQTKFNSATSRDEKVLLMADYITYSIKLDHLVKQFLNPFRKAKSKDLIYHIGQQTSKSYSEKE